MKSAIPSARRAEFLAEVGAVLASSLDYDETLRQVARSAVPTMATWCVVDLLESDGAIRVVAVAHAEPRKEAMVRALRERYPFDPEAPHGLPLVLRTGRPARYEAVQDEWRRAAARDAQHLRLMRSLDARSTVCAPLLARGRVLGAITLVTSEPDRSYRSSDLGFVEELARRAALAIENARLYRQARRAQDAEREAREQVERLAAERERFFANASHDLRTPVATIKASIEVLLRNEPPGTDPVLHRLLVNIDREADRMATLVADLLELQRLRSGHVPLRMTSCDLRIVATQARDAVLPLTDQRRQRIDLNLPSAPVRALVDGERLERAVVNLLANAQKYGREGGHICLCLLVQRGEAIFSVEDDGPGIPPADRERLFDRYYRADTEATRREQGSGLGLPIVRATAERHGGRVWVEDSPGGGATFKLAIPVRARRKENQRGASR